MFPTLTEKWDGKSGKERARRARGWGGGRKEGDCPQREGSNRLSERKPGNGCSFLSWSSLELRRDL